MNRMLLLVAGLVLVLAGCELLDPLRQARTAQEDNDDKSDPPQEVVVFDRLEDVALAKDHATIQEARVEGDVLTLTVVHGGGCREHTYGLYAARYLAESYPPQAFLYLSHDADGDACRALLTRKLRFDLSGLKQAWNLQGGPVTLHLYAPGDSAASQTVTLE